MLLRRGAAGIVGDVPLLTQTLIDANLSCSKAGGYNGRSRPANLTKGTGVASRNYNMLLLPQLRQNHPQAAPLRCGGFTLVEVMAGVSMLGLVTATVIFGLNQLNYYASVNRLFTAAQTLAQNQIDIVLTKGPYDPATNKYPDPNVLRTDATYYTNPVTGSISTSATGSYIVPIYKDPSSNQNIVTGTIATTVTDTGVLVGGTSLNLRQATVTVSYTFRGKTFSVKMDTMRAPDV